MSSNQFGESVKQEVFEGESALVHVDAEDDDEENMKDTLNRSSSRGQIRMDSSKS